MQSNNWVDLDKADIWWNQVSGPKAFLKTVAENVKMGRCMALNSNNLDTSFQAILQKRIMENDSSYVFDTFYANAYESASEFIDALIARVTKDFVIGFMSPYKRIIDSKILVHHLIYLELEKDNVPTWVPEVMKEFSALSSTGNGVFIALTPSILPFDKVAKLKTLSLKKYVSLYNLQYFALQCLGDFESNDSKGMYIAQLAAKLSDGTGSLCAELAKPKLFSDTMDMCQSLDLPEEKTARAIWETQIQIFLPIIEEIRQKLITNNWEKIENLLSTTKTDEFGNVLQEPMDMELRHLKFYGLNVNSYFFNPADSNWFQIAYDARNALSHLKLLSPKAMDDLFDIERALKQK